jgi:hypothetical protein
LSGSVAQIAACISYKSLRKGPVMFANAFSYFGCWILGGTIFSAWVYFRLSFVLRKLTVLSENLYTIDPENREWNDEEGRKHKRIASQHATLMQGERTPMILLLAALLFGPLGMIVGLLGEAHLLWLSFCFWSRKR